MRQPTRPTHLSEHAERTLQALAAAGLGHAISLGGALGLLHYLDYRFTHDVDAWWEPSVSADDRERVLQVVRDALQPSGDIRTRRWGEVVSVELIVSGKTIFSFQIADRSARLEPSSTLSWADVSIDSLADLVASKMVALVERGAPRDFRDIHALCHSGLMTAGECWDLWRLRQQRSGSDTDAHRARLALSTHLSRIAQHRPLESIANPDERTEAESLRTWFTTEFLDALLD
ncbi:MAG TPA: nucleotidyl transferase AbiEii/AbiGii toxin family protein [Thermoanaerobaculia bacterium]|nr:nucleotidyl transferase AbiEii/AbiGii toxin family protein [Thermoanaerobaculia bacterium]